MTHTKSILLGATALAMLAGGSAARAQSVPGVSVVFLPAPSPDTLPAQCRGSTFVSTYTEGISADGRVVAGRATTSQCVVLWRNGVPEVPNLGYAFFGTQLSGDGRTTVGFNGVGGSSGGFRVYNVGATLYWSASGGTQVMPTISTLTAAQWNANPPLAIIDGFTGRIGRASGDVIRIPTGPGYVNNDGTFFAVNSAYRGSWDYGNFGSALPFQFDGRVLRWSPTSGYQELPTFGANIPMSTTGIDGSGNRIIGVALFGQTLDQNGLVRESDFRAFLWDASSGLSRLPDLAATFGNPDLFRNTEATSISRDGTTIIGVSRAANGVVSPVFWRDGSVTNMGFLAGRTPTTTQRFDDNRHIPIAASAMGRVIVGTTGNGEDTFEEGTAWRWTAATGMQDLNLIATNAGLRLNGFVLTGATGISDDGQFIAGNSFNAAQNQSLGYVLQLAQVTQSRLIVTLRGPGVTQTSIVNQTFSTQVDALLNGQSVFTRTVADPITATSGVTALTDARAALQVGSGLRRVVIGSPTLVSNTTTVLSTTNSTVDVPTGTTTTTASVNTFGPTTVATGDRGTCATPAANNTNPTGCSLPGTPVTVDAGILNTNVFTNTINTVTPTTTPTVNQLISARWQVSATAGNQFGTVHALVGPATFEASDRFVMQLLSQGDGSGTGVSAFGSAYGSKSTIDADARVPVAKVEGEATGVAFGLERSWPNGRFGFGIDHGTTEFDVRDPDYGEKLETTLTQVALFGAARAGRASFSGAVSYGFGQAETRLGSPTGFNKAKRDLSGYSLGAQAGFDVIDHARFDLRGVAGVRYAAADLKAFTETGGSNPLIGLDRTVSRTRTYAGLEANADWGSTARSIYASAYARIATDAGDQNGIASLVLASAPRGSTLLAYGPDRGETATELGASLTAKLSPSTTLSATYDGAFNDKAQTQSARIGVSVVF